MNIRKVFLILFISSLFESGLAQEDDDFELDMECAGPCDGDTVCKTYFGIGFCPHIAQCVKEVCVTDDDCRLFNNYSEEFPCTCNSVQIDAPDPICGEEQTVHCVAEPCHDLMPICENRSRRILTKRHRNLKKWHHH